MSDVLLAPDELAEVLDSPDFTAMEPADQLAIFDNGIKASEAWVQQNGGFDESSRQSFDEAIAARRQQITGRGQSPLSTAARSFMTGAGEVFTGTVEGLGGLATDVAQAADQLSGIPGVGQSALGAVPMAQGLQAAAPFAEAAQQEIDRTYAPDARLNPWSATLGGAAGQAVAMMPSAVAGPAGPLTLGGAMGYGQGREQATELGVTDPLGRMVMGAGFAGAELLTERLGGLGAGPMTQAFGDVVQRMGGSTLKTIGSEAIEEPITGFAQDAMSFGAGKLVEDPNRPGFTTTGVALAPLSPLSPQALDRRVQELAGGAVGGAVFAGAARLAGAGAPKAGSGEQGAGSGPPPLPLPEGEAGASDEDFDAFDQTLASANTGSRSETPAVPGPQESVGGSTPPTGANQTPASQRPATTNQEPGTKNQEPIPSIDNIGAKFRGPEMARAVPVIPDNPLGYRDSLDFLNEMPIAIGRSGTGGELDWQETASVPKYYRPFIASEQGLPIDVVAQAAYDAQLIPQPTADALMERVQRDIGERRQYRVQGREQQRDMLAREREAVNFDKAQTKLQRKPTAQQVPLDMLATGDQLTIDGEPVTVRAVESDESGYVTKVVLEDGKKFGVQAFNPETREGVFVDEYQPRPQLAGENSVFSRAQRELGKGLAELMGQRAPSMAQGVPTAPQAALPQPQPQPLTSTPLSRTLLDQAEAAAKAVPSWQRGDLYKLFARARNLLAQDGNLEVHRTDPVTVPQALAKIAAGEEAALVAGQWAQHRNDYMQGKTTEASPWTPGLPVPSSAWGTEEPAPPKAATVKESLTVQPQLSTSTSTPLTREQRLAKQTALNAGLSPTEAEQAARVPDFTARAAQITGQTERLDQAALRAAMQAEGFDAAAIDRATVGTRNFQPLLTRRLQALLTGGDPMQRVKAAYQQLDRTGQGYVRIPDLARAAGLSPEETRAALAELDDNGQAYLTPADEPRNIPEADRPYLVNGPSGKALFVTLAPEGVQSPSSLADNQRVNEAELTKLGLPTSTTKAVWGQKPVKEAMSRIAKDARLPATVRRMAKLLQDANLTGLFLRVEADGRKQFTGQYQPLQSGQGELTINPRHLGVGNTDPALNMAETLVHEVLHHATYRALRGPKNDVQKSAIGNLEQLRRRVKAVLGSQQLADFDYQTSNLDEFIAALFTQKPFQDALAGIPAERAPKSLVQQVRTLLDEAFRLLAEIVTGKKVPPGSVLDAAFQNALRLVEDGVRVAATEKVGALASPAPPPRLPEPVPSEAVPLKPEFGGAFPDHQAYKATDMQAWAAAEAQRLGADGVAAAVEAGQFGPVDVPFVLAAAMMDTNAALKAATTQADQTRQQVRLNRLRALLTPQNSVAGQALAAQRDALGPMRDRVPSLAVDEAVEKAQVQTIDAAVPVQPTVDGLDGLATQASAEATDTLSRELGAGSTEPDQAAEDELTRLRQQVTAQRNQFARYTEQLQRVMQKLMASGQRKAAILKGLRDEVQMSGRNAIERAKAAMKGLRSPAQGAANAVDPNVAQVGFHTLVSEGVGFDAWSAAMVRTLGPMQPSTLEAVYGAALNLYEQAVDRLDAQAKAKTPSKPRTTGTAKADAVATGFPDLAKMLRKLGPAISGLNWRQIMTSTATAQRQWELDTYAQIRQHPKLSTLNPEQAKALTRELSKAWQRERRKVWKRELDKTLIAAGMAKPKHRAKIEASAPRLLALINLGALNAATFRDAVAKEFGLRSIHDAEVQKVKALAEDLQTTPEGVPYRRKAQAFIDGLQDLTKLTTPDLLQSYWTAAVLSGWRTQTDIFLGFANGLEDLGLSGLGRTLRTAKPRAAGQALLAFLGNMPQALGEAAHHMLTGDRSLMKNYDAQVLGALEDGQKTIGSSARALVQRGGWRTIPGWGMEAVARMMTALGHITTSSTFEGAKWLAIANHPDLYQRALTISAADRAAAKHQARQVLTGGVEPVTMADKLAEKRYAMELLDEKFSNKEILGEAQTFANETALEGDPTGLGMLFMSLVQGLTVTAPNMAIKAAEEAKFHKAILWLMRGAAVWAKPLAGVKFARTVSHSINRNMSYVPGVGAVRFGMDAKWGTVKGDRLLAAQLVGIMFCAAFKMWWLGDDEEDKKQGKPQRRGIEGGWEGLTAEQKAQNYAAGKKPWHLWELDKNGKIRTVNYQNWGISSLLAALGQMQDRERYQGVTDHMSLLLSGLMTGAFAWTDKAQLQGLQILTGKDSPYSTSDPELASLKKVNKWAATMVGGFIPRIAKDIDAVIDPSLRRTDEWWQVWARELPIARSQSSGKRLDIFGQEIKLDRGPMSRVYQAVTLPMEYKVLGALNERGVTLPDPSFHPRKVPMINGPARDMTTPERDRYQRITGELYRAYIADPKPQPRYLKLPDGRFEQVTLTNAQYLLKLPPEDAQEAISKATKTMRAQAVLQATKR